MRLENETYELQQLARAFQIISKEISYQGLANALLKQALGYCQAERGGILLSEGGELLASVDASFPREKAKFFISEPTARDFRLTPDLEKRVLGEQEIVLRQATSHQSALIDPVEAGPANINQLCVPLIHQGWTVGVLYLETALEEALFTEKCVWVMSMLASQAAVSFGSARLFEALRETNMWMVRGQEIGRMGSYRWNTRTLLSRASRECYRVFDLDLDLNPVPFEVFRSRVHAEDYPALEQALTKAVADKSPFSHEYRVVHRDGTILHVAAAGQFDVGPSGDVELEGIISDITERKAAEQTVADARTELARAAHLASVGELAGSIIHEINQPLTGMMTSAEACLNWLTRDPPQPGEAHKSATRVIEQGRRANEVVAGLKSLVRNAPLRVAELDINEAIEEVLRLTRRDIERASVTLQTNLGRPLPAIEADRIQLQQVVLNLVRNAVEAMSLVDERRRVLTVSSAPADDHVSIAVADTGIGINAADKTRLFDAFFTTKGSGLGLGLSICRKIVSVHGGRLWVEENTTHGATFVVILPLRRPSQLPGRS